MHDNNSRLHISYKKPRSGQNDDADADGDEHASVDIPLVGDDDDEGTPFYCLPCTEQKKQEETPDGDAAFGELTGGADQLEEKAMRLGYNIDAPPDGHKVERDDNLHRKLNKYVENSRATIGNDGLVDQILASTPRPYPTHKPMDEKMRRLSAIHGRRFEWMQLNFVVPKCECCGIVRPFQADSWYPQHGLGNFRRKHFNKQYHDVYQCTCRYVCKGS
jgi:hypothetical protein